MVMSNNIEIKGACEHNLKSIDIEIPRNKFIVVTGVSGSGKSTLAFDTLYAEGQRRYVESLSSYARQFLGRIHKPKVEYIKGIPPAIAIEQKVNTRNPRSTVGTSTEIYDYLKLLYARIGKTFSPISNNIVMSHSVTDVVNYIKSYDVGSKIMILSEIVLPENRTLNEQLDILLKQGYARVELTDSKGVESVERINNLLADKNKSNSVKSIKIIIDRLSVATDNDTISSMGDSVQTAFFEGAGKCIVKVFVEDKTNVKIFSNKFELDGVEFEIPSVHMFSFNNPFGACPKCEGYGNVIGIDENLIIPNKNLSIYDGAIACWSGEKMGLWKKKLILNSPKFNFPIHKPFYKLTKKQVELLWNGNRHFEGLNDFFEMLENESYKIQFRVMLSRYKGKTICPECNGTRLKKESSYVKIGNMSINELVIMPIDEMVQFFENLKLNEHDKSISKRILIEINNRLQYLTDVGLSYLTLNRLSSTLSGGESQRINLSTSLGSGLIGSLYILDEPSIGLHQRDTERLIKVLRNLQKSGNTVIVVEHDEDIIKAADYIIDIGPLAGTEGGKLVFQGTKNDLLNNKNSLTSKYLTGEMQIPVPNRRRKWNNYIEVIKAHENNLKEIDVKFPLNILTVVTGVSGSGKSTLVNNILFSALNKRYNGYGEITGNYDTIKGDFQSINHIEYVSQNPIGKSSRSNPVTYTKAYDEIRKLYSTQQGSVINAYKPSHFSFNVEGGRCEECKGDGFVKIEMQFMADVILECEHCNGMRFKQDVLDVKYNGKNIFELLELTINEALEFFSSSKGSLEKKIIKKMKPLSDVGLGYVKLGQSSNTLSGGESQRIKLASFLGKESSLQKALFIFDEPTTGLHFHDINKLLGAFNALIDKGHSIIIIEHNPEVIKTADWIIDLGPEGGKNGGEIIFEGTPDDIIKCKKSYTGMFMKN